MVLTSGPMMAASKGARGWAISETEREERKGEAGCVRAAAACSWAEGKGSDIAAQLGHEMGKKKLGRANERKAERPSG